MRLNENPISAGCIPTLKAMYSTKTRAKRPCEMPMMNPLKQRTSRLLLAEAFSFSEEKTARREDCEEGRLRGPRD
jgi:hypothetical protein